MPSQQHEPAHGNLKHAMRDNYNEHGVDEYYRRVASTYRNPFFPGIKKVLFAFMNRWYEQEGASLGEGALRVLDMAAGSGEATICLLEWEQAARGHATSSSSSGVAGYAQGALSTTSPAHSSPSPSPSPSPSLISGISSAPPVSRAFIPPNARRGVGSGSGESAGGPSGKRRAREQLGWRQARMDAGSAGLVISATDPFTAPAYTQRTGRACHPLSFADLASGQMPPLPLPLASTPSPCPPHTALARTGDCADPALPDSAPATVSALAPIPAPPLDTDGAAAAWDVIVCSFALHLVPEGEMFPLCWTLSTRARWLVVVAPHKKPEIKDGWGWTRWDLREWIAAGDKVYRRDGGDEDETELEIVREKTKLRLYRSTQLV